MDDITGPLGRICKNVTFSIMKKTGMARFPDARRKTSIHKKIIA